jgi:hypothetical protein
MRFACLIMCRWQLGILLTCFDIGQEKWTSLGIGNQSSNNLCKYWKSNQISGLFIASCEYKKSLVSCHTRSNRSEWFHHFWFSLSHAHFHLFFF